MTAKWNDVDLFNRIWFVPRENVKGRLAGKQEHFIHISDFTLPHFLALKTVTGESEWCYPNRNNDNHIDLKTVTKIISDRQIKFKNRTEVFTRRRQDNSLVIGDREWNTHDLRRTGSTIMQELDIPLHVIDRCQNHVAEGPKVRRHYLKHNYAKEKRHAWGALGDYISDLLK